MSWVKKLLACGDSGVFADKIVGCLTGLVRSDPTKRQLSDSAGSGAPAGSELEVLPVLEAPVCTEAPVQTGPSGETEAPVRTRAPVFTTAWV